MLFKALALVILTAIPAAAQSMLVSDAWFRSLPGNLPAGGYFTIHNNTAHDVKITGARADACGMLMMHQSTSQGGMSGMDMVDKVEIPAGASISFAPGSYHLMCENPRLKIGTKVPVILSLSDGSAVAVAFVVKGARGR